MKTRNTSHATFFEASGSVVGSTWEIEGDSSYDGHYEEVESYFWLESLGVRHRCSQADIADFIRSAHPTDCAGLASYYAQALHLGRIVRSDSPLYDWLPPLTGVANRDPEFVGELLQFWTCRFPDIISGGSDRTARLLEHRISPDTSSVISQTVVWAGDPYSPAATS